MSRSDLLMKALVEVFSKTMITVDVSNSWDFALYVQRMCLSTITCQPRSTNSSTKSGSNCLRKTRKFTRQNGVSGPHIHIGGPSVSIEIFIA